MTNEERLRSSGTRELAKELALLVLYDMPLYDRLHNVFESGESAVIDECEKWLKEKHGGVVKTTTYCEVVARWQNEKH